MGINQKRLSRTSFGIKKLKKGINYENDKNFYKGFFLAIVSFDR